MIKVLILDSVDEILNFSHLEEYEKSQEILLLARENADQVSQGVSPEIFFYYFTSVTNYLSVLDKIRVDCDN